jgi:Protein of unknown function (DUF2442)
VQLVDVIAVEAVGDFRLRLTFEDGTVGEVDFAEGPWRGAFEPLADPTHFARVRVDPELGTIVWPNGVDMAPEPCMNRPDATPSVASPRLARPPPLEPLGSGEATISRGALRTRTTGPSRCRRPQAYGRRCR